MLGMVAARCADIGAARPPFLSCVVLRGRVDGLMVSENACVRDAGVREPVCMCVQYGREAWGHRHCSG